MPKFIGWVPTQTEYIKAFFDLAPLSAGDTVYDLGSGDGRLLFTALEMGAGRCIGIDIDPDRVNVAREAAKSKGLDGKVSFFEADIMEVNLSEASVITCYLFPTASAALRPKFEKELKAGTRIVMESFPVPGWKPVKTSEVNARNFYLYTMPAERTADYDTAIQNVYLEPYDGFIEYSAG
jgi:SAM-dependent methyltransferase